MAIPSAECVFTSVHYLSTAVGAHDSAMVEDLPCGRMVTSSLPGHWGEVAVSCNPSGAISLHCLAPGTFYEPYKPSE